MWLYTGRDLTRTDAQSQNNEELTFGSLGIARIRRTLIGRQLHERFTVELSPDAESSTDAIPLNGIQTSDPGEETLVFPYINGNRVMNPLRWPGIKLSPGAMERRSSAQIKVINICAARLLRRTATMTQMDLIVGPGELGHANSRKGVLGWTAIDASCPAPDGKVRSQAGPFYHSQAEYDRLADWNQSYMRLRSPELHPEEWRVAPEPAWRTVDERMEPLLRRISDLQLAQSGADLNCEISKKCESPQQTQERKRLLARLTQEAAQQRKALECELEKKCE